MNATPDNPESLLRFWQPRYWPLWLAIALLRALVLLPYRAQLALGRAAGRLMFRLMRRRRAVAEVNLALCFRELGAEERDALLRRHFASLGIAIFEMALAWWGSDRLLARLVRVKGIEHLDRAMQQGRGVIVLSGHFAATELTGRVLRSSHSKLAALYRPVRDPLLDALLRRGRGRATDILIRKDSIRQFIRALRQGYALWYAPDQSYRRQQSVLVPFFDEPAMTNGALTQIARLSGSPVVPYFPRRLDDGSGYEVTILPPLEDFPTGDLAADARRILALFEERIRLAPEQYYWIHRRFKGRPESYPDPYRRL